MVEPSPTENSNNTTQQAQSDNKVELTQDLVYNLLNKEIYQAIKDGKYQEARMMGDGQLIEYLITDAGNTNYTLEQLKQVQKETIDSLIEVQEIKKNGGYQENISKTSESVVETGGEATASEVTEATTAITEEVATSNETTIEAAAAEQATEELAPSSTVAEDGQATQQVETTTPAEADANQAVQEDAAVVPENTIQEETKVEEEGTTTNVTENEPISEIQQEVKEDTTTTIQEETKVEEEPSAVVAPIDDWQQVPTEVTDSMITPEIINIAGQGEQGYDLLKVLLENQLDEYMIENGEVAYSNHALEVALSERMRQYEPAAPQIEQPAPVTINNDSSGSGVYGFLGLIALVSFVYYFIKRRNALQKMYKEDHFQPL